MNRKTLLATERLMPMREQIRWDLYLSLAESRYDKGLSQNQLAELSGVPQATIARVENGKLNPTLSTIVKLAEALDVWMELTPRSPRTRHLL